MEQGRHGELSLNEVHMTLRKALCGRGLAFGAADDWGAVGARLSAGGVDGIAVVLAQDNDALHRLLTEADARLASGKALDHEGADLQTALLAHLTGAPFDRQRAGGIAAQAGKPPSTSPRTPTFPKATPRGWAGLVPEPTTTTDPFDGDPNHGYDPDPR